MANKQPMSFGEQLRRYREAACLSQEELAERAGLSARGISDLERGERRHPYPHTVRLLAEALGLSAEDRATLTAAVPKRGGARTPDHVPLGVPLHSLPATATPLVGRARQLATLVDVLQDEARLLTLTGVGGTGKTRLALQVATEMQECFADGAVFVSLASIEDPELVPLTVEHALGLTEVPGRTPVERIVDHLCDRHLLLVLDNFEHLLPATPIVGELLAAAPGLKVLATSRVSLRLYGEYEFRVPPLDLPDRQRVSTEELMRGEAVQLFVERVRAVRLDFELTRENAPVVADLCERLDGLPLAIELAAARTRLFTPQALLERLESRLSLLTGGPRNLPERQQTLRDTLGWSYDLLGAEEQELFGRLGVFVGGFGVHAVEAVCRSGLDALDSLAGQGLLEYVQWEQPRFRMLETVREYALARLTEAGETEAVHRRHAEYYLELARSAELHLAGPQQTVWSRILESELGNLRAALGWMLDRDAESALVAATSLERFWARRDHLSEGHLWLDAALGRCQAPGRVRAKGLVAAGQLAARLGKYEWADALLEEGQSIYEGLRDTGGIAAARSAMGVVALHRGDFPTSSTLLEEALVLCRELGDRSAIADNLCVLGLALLPQGDLDRADSAVLESGALFRELGDRWGTAFATMHQAGVPLFRSEYQQAEFLLRDALMLWREVADDMMAAICVIGLGVASGGMGNNRRAVHLVAAGEAALERCGALRPPAHHRLYEWFGDQIRGPMDERSFEAVWAEGRVMPLDSAVAEALK